MACKNVKSAFVVCGTKVLLCHGPRTCHSSRLESPVECVRPCSLSQTRSAFTLIECVAASRATNNACYAFLGFMLCQKQQFQTMTPRLNTLVFISHWPYIHKLYTRAFTHHKSKDQLPASRAAKWADTQASPHLRFVSMNLSALVHCSSELNWILMEHDWPVLVSSILPLSIR